MPAEMSSNGVMAPEVSLRIAFIGLSIRSAWQNPAAETHRAVGRALMARGHHFAFYEARQNEAIVGEFKSVGSGPLRGFDERYPDLIVRSYDPPPRRELGVWLGQIASAHDLVALLFPLQDDLLDLFQRLQAPHVVRLIERDQNSSTLLADLVTGSVVTPYHPLDVGESAAGRAAAIEQAWIAAGIRF